MDPKEQLKQFTEKFGAELANKYFTEGLDFNEAVAKFCDVLQERLKDTEKLLSEKDAEITALKKAAEEDEEDDDEKKDKGGKKQKDDDDDDEDDDDEKKDKNKQSIRVAELEAELRVWRQQYGGVPYDKFADASPDVNIPDNVSKAEDAYAASIKAALAQDGE